jgi:hypothetical protein
MENVVNKIDELIQELKLLKKNLTDSPFIDENHVLVFSIINQHKKHGITKRELTIKTQKMSVKERQEIIQRLAIDKKIIIGSRRIGISRKQSRIYMPNPFELKNT